MRETVFILAALLLFADVTSANAESKLLLEVPTRTFKVPRNAQEGDVIVGSEHVRAAKDLDESLNLELEGTNPSPIAINGSIVDGGQAVRFVLVNKAAFENGRSRVKLQALGVISGKVQEETIHFETESSSILPPIPDIPNFVVKSDFRDKETAIVRVGSTIPSGSELEVLGSHAPRVQASFQDDNIILDTVPCEEAEPCAIQFPFTVILVLRNGESHEEALLTFEEEKRSALKMDQKVYETTIEEHTGEQDRLLKVTARGNSSEVLYSLRDAVTGLFSIHPREGILSTLHPEFVTIASLGDTVNLTAVATDGENTVHATIRVRIAERVARNAVFGFEQPAYDVRLDSVNSRPPVLKVATPSAAAAAATALIYHITEGRADLYKVEPSGELLYTGPLLKEDRRDELVVAVSEGLRMSSARVRVHLEGIGSHPVSTTDDVESLEVVSADEPTGVVIATIRFEDRDEDAKLQYTLEQEQELFELKEGESGQVHVIVGGDLLASNVSTAHLTITADDVTHPKEPSLTVKRTVVLQRELVETHRTDVNLVPLPSNLTVPLDLPVGSFVYRAVVSPPARGNVTYQISPEHTLKIFSDGSIVTRKVLSEEAASIPIKIDVQTDLGGSASSESVILLRRTTRAHFGEQRYEASVPRGSAAGTVVTLVTATNGDGEPATDFVLKGAHAKLFDVDARGAVTTRDTSLFEAAEFDFLVALASDPTISAPIHVRLAEPRAPTIGLRESQLFATVFDDLPIRSYVAKVQVRADDEDDVEPPVKFTMSSEEKGMSELFEIEPDGTIRSTDWLAGHEGMHKFAILASSVDQAGVRSTNATLVVDVLKSEECAPKFKPDENLIFYVRENTPKDTVIGKVSAEVLAAKCDLEFSLGNEEVLTVNEANGELRTSREFDFERQTSHMIVLKLVAGKHNVASTTAEVRVVDVDDHAVRFDAAEQTVEVSEDTPPTTVIATVRAIEEDQQPVYYHLGATSPPEFSLHSTSGAITLEQPLDRELAERYSIDVGVSNAPDTRESEWAARTRVHVRVRDVNDNGPRFDRATYWVVAEKDVLVGSRLVELHATDPDVEDSSTSSSHDGNGRRLEYSVSGASFEYRGMSRSVEAVFDVIPTSGWVCTLGALSDYVGGVFHVALQVRDTLDGTIGRSSLRVYVHETSDVLAVELPHSASTVSAQCVDELAEQLSNATGLTALPKRVVYKAPHGVMSTNTVELQTIFFNASLSEIVPAERVLARRDRMMSGSSVSRGGLLAELRRPAPLVSYGLDADRRADTLIQPELFFIVLAFLVLLAIVLALCGMMACFARSRFLREKRIVENDVAIKDAIQFPSNRSPALVSFKHYAPPPPPDLYRSREEHMYRSPHLDEKVGSYAIQQATITVAEHEEKI